ncbi:unnamed protein product [Camellia sinensis]
MGRPPTLLTKIALTEEEEAIVVGDDHLKPAEEKSWLCLVGKVLSMRPFNSDALRTTMESVWNPSKGMRTKVINKNLFLFQFNHIIDKRRVLYNGPWSFDKHLLLLKEVTDSWQPLHITFSTATFWVQVYDLPLISMTRAVGQLLGNRLGQFVDVDFEEGGVDTVGFVSELVAEFGTSQGLVRGVRQRPAAGLWQPPCPRWYKVNFDGVITACSKRVPSWANADAAEAYAALSAVQFVRELCLSAFQLEGDCSLIIKALQSG